MKLQNPLGIKDLRRLKFDEPREVPCEYEDVTLFTFKLPNGAEPVIRRNWKESGAFDVTARLSSEHIEYGCDQLVKPTPTARIPVTSLGTECLRQYGQIEAVGGKRPAYAPASYLPRVSQIDLDMADRSRRRQRNDDHPTQVFGSDDRYVYHDTSFPWRTVGRVWTEGGACSGCTIGPRLVLTGSHCINWLNDGGAGWVKFSPAYYNGNGPWGEFYAERVICWNKAEGSLGDFETAFDYVVLVMNDYVGNRVGYPGYRAYEDAWNGLDVWQHMGYPGDLTSTERPSFQGACSVASTRTETTSGPSGLILGHFNDVSGGHSGGPVWGWWSGEEWPRVVGVQSAEAASPSPDPAGDNELGGGPGLSGLISWARNNYP